MERVRLRLGRRSSNEKALDLARVFPCDLGEVDALKGLRFLLQNG